MGTAANVNMGPCTVTFGGTDLGYTKGAVQVNYSAETVEKTVDQENAPLDEVITKESCEVTIPLAEFSATKLAELLPGATVASGVLSISGAAGSSLKALEGALIITPLDSSAADVTTLPHAVPVPQLSFAYEKENVRVFEVKFKALKGTNGFVKFGKSA